MSERVYTTIDKSGWGEGPWQDEPDKVQWKDEASGLPCLAKRNWHMGNWCGYVGVPAGHPFFERNYNEVAVEVHGDLSFSDHCEEGGDEATAICHVPEPGEPDDVWWLGFDCGHAFDLMPAYEALSASLPLPPRLQAGLPPDRYRTLDYVRQECAQLAAQLVEAA